MVGWIFFTAASGQTIPGEFYEPWKDATKALVLDPFGGNGLDWNELTKEPRVAGIIHKASEPMWDERLRRRVLKLDPKYIIRRAEAKRRGYKWGSYHLGRPGYPVAQADFYLSEAQPADDEVMALDLEDTTDKRFMNLVEAQIFIERIREKTGRYPLLYMTDKVRKAILEKYGTDRDSVFAKTPLWYARYCQDIRGVFPAPTPFWDSYTLWQFASEINCPSVRASEVKNCPPTQNANVPYHLRCPAPITVWT